MPRYGLIVFASGVCLTPNRSLDRKSTTGNGEDYFLTSFVFCWHLVFRSRRSPLHQRLTINNLLNKPIKSVQDLMTDLG